MNHEWMNEAGSFFSIVKVIWTYAGCIVIRISVPGRVIRKCKYQSRPLVTNCEPVALIQSKKEIKHQNTKIFFCSPQPRNK